MPPVIQPTKKYPNLHIATYNMYRIAKARAMLGRMPKNLPDTMTVEDYVKLMCDKLADLERAYPELRRTT